MPVFGLFPHLKKEQAIPAAQRLVERLTEAGNRVVMTMDDAGQIGCPELGLPDDQVKSVMDMGLVLGGDGALLYAARFIYPQATPLFGINLGHLGFLTEFDSGQIDEVVQSLIEGKYFLEDRMMITATVLRGGQAVQTMVGLNDIVVAKGAIARMLRIRMSIDGQHIADYPADGLIIATPTGSTAYSLAAGGPILDPRISALIITPICAHSIFALPLVVGGNAAIDVEFAVAPSEVMLTADGQVGFALEPEDCIRLTAAPHPTRLVRFKERSFYEILRERVKAGKL